ncbi:MAG: hypothetical protein CMI56_00725 [Parcubacteria group bacterium]|nr:hypothetical protein [Parcubacteria group bacterium]|tara:strand:+ start:651 stop:1706 length:1056 start_codon:yes stop_codon:yes gene_type:complete
MKLVKTQKGFSVRYKTEFGVRTTKLSSTNEREAKQEIKDSKIAELEQAANAGALTMDVISKLMSGRNMTCQDALKEWNEWRKSEGKSLNTLNTQTEFIESFCKKHFGLKKPVNKITHKLVSAWVNDETIKVGVSTRNAWLSAISAFLSFCSTRQYVPKNPASIVSVNKKLLSHEQKEKKKVQPITDKEFKKIINNLDGCFKSDETNEFWKNVCTISYWLGLRLGDCINLEWESLTKDSIIVWTEKRDSRVSLPINAPKLGGGVLRDLFAGIDYDGGRFVFDKMYRDKIADPKKRHYFSQQFTEICNRIGIEGKSFHSFRHAFATRHKDMELTEVAEMLGHKNTKTTKGYTH